jgi:5-methylthioadenosine/S-adenosylhomocysteine deaminase
MQAILEDGLVLQPDFSLRQESLVVDGRFVKDRGSATRMRQSHRGFKRLDFSGHLVCPGFVNAHTHAALSLARGLGDGLPLFEMFEKVLFPLEKRVKDADAYLGALVSGIEFVRTGTTSVHNINASWHKGVVKAFCSLGLRGTLAVACKDTDIKTHETFKPRGLEENERLVRELEDDALLQGAFGLANEVEASQDLIESVRQKAAERKSIIHLHAAESLGEKGFIMQRTGKTSVRYLYDLGVLNERSLAVHCVNITSSDIDLLAKSRATVVHCPTVNLNLASGISPVREMLSKGVSVGIGVDDPIANMSNDLRIELGVAKVLQQSIGGNLSLRNMASMMWNGRVLNSGVGTIREGGFADLFFLDLRKKVVPASPNSLLREALLGRRTVNHSMIGGEWVLKDKHVLGVDEARVTRDAQKACDKLTKGIA